jgi:hypothetical protein
LAVAVALGGGAALWGAATGAGGREPPAPVTAADLPGVPPADAAAVAASEGWLRLTRRPAPALRPLGGAHPGAVSIRVDRSRAALTGRRGRQRFPYPRGTTIVKVVTLRGNLSMVALMRKVARGQAPASWRYAEYALGREGAFERVAGGQSLCRGCHVSARDEQRSDWVFSRLGPPPG